MVSATVIEQFDLVLVGGGHANIQVLRSFAMKPIDGLRITLVSDVSYAPYSGMLPGLLAGWYSFDEVHFDLRSICQKSGTRFIQAEVCGLDTEKKELRLRGRPNLAYDIASVNIGSVPTPLSGASKKNLIPLKPISSLLEKWDSFVQELEITSTDLKKIAVVGGGAAGFEVSIALSILLNKKSIAHEIILVSKTKILPRHSARTQTLATRALAENKIRLVRDEVQDFDEKALKLKSSSIDVDFVFVATKAKAPTWLQATGLPLNTAGFIKVSPSLQVAGHEELFAAGDCVAFANRDLVKSGVYAVRQGPVLAENIRRKFLGHRLKSYVPQRSSLALLICGEKQAIASRSFFAISGQSIWRWKDQIDRKFMDKFKTYPEMSDVKVNRSNVKSISRENFTLNTCGGCGAKVAPQILSQVLAELKSNKDYLLTADLGKDDGSIHTFQPGQSVINSVDAFRSFIDDPYLFAKISVEHALNDIYAMAATPTSAQVLVFLKRMHPLLEQRDLRQIMHGITEQLSLAKVELSGGHTVAGSEVSIGLSVLGTSKQPIKKQITRTDSLLILTKPIGSGAILNAHMSGSAKAIWIEKMFALMLQSQKNAAQIFANCQVDALTDVTGFGLLGHALEMIKDSKVALELHPSEIPVYDGLLECMRAGFFSQLTEENKKSNIDLVENFQYQQIFLFDPQTSGGLDLPI